MRRLFLRLSAGLAVGGLVLLVTHFSEGITAFREGIDLYASETDFGALTQFNLIDTEFDFSLGCYMENETTTTNKYGTVTGKSYSYYYAIPVYTESQTFWIGLEVPERYMDTMEQITDETYNYLMREDDYFGYTTLRRQGRIRKMTDEQYSYFKVLFSDLGYSAEEMEEFVKPYYITTFDAADSRALFLLACALFLIGAAGFGVVIAQGTKGRSRQGRNGTVPYEVGMQRSDTIVIAGTAYPRKWFENIDQYVARGEFDYAKQDLRSLTGITYEEAEELIRNWKNV